jgi:flagellar hook-basal body complex protein FliE
MNTASISSTIAGLTGADAAGTNPLAQAGASTTEAPFAGLLKDAIHSEQSLEDQASAAAEGLMTGQGVDVHQAMIAAQKANLAFEMALAVRNKAVAAYQQVMQMQF